MRRLMAVLAVTLFALPACGGGDDDSASGGETRTVLTDFNFDEFATWLGGFFPLTVAAHPGDTIDFKQAWTGEPHTVTMGKLVEPLGNAMKPYLRGEKPPPEEEPAEVIEAAKGIPQFFSEDEGDAQVNQAGGQPCYITSGAPPEQDACPKARQEQPAFDGRQDFYNSGFIPYEGNNGNHFRVPLSDDIAPAEYFFFCLVHGGPMGGYVKVVPEGEDIPSTGEVRRRAQKELDSPIKRLKAGYEKAQKGETEAAGAGADIAVGAPIDGFGFPFGEINEFVPKTFRAKVGQKVTFGAGYHTVSFNVPKYGPQIIVEKDGTVKFNPKAYEPVGMEIPPPLDEDSEEPVTVDVGDYDGSKFISTGVIDYPMLLAITFTKPGTYKYACLIHPPMVGSVVVSR